MTTPGTRTPGPPPAHPAQDPGGPDRPAAAGTRPRPTVRGLGPAVPLLPAAVMLALGLWGLEGRGPWRDEVATYEVALRDWGQIRHLLQHVDAVHGLYYLLMHGVFLLFGDSLANLRLPSVAAMAVAAAGVALIGRRLAGSGAGLTAGLLFAVTPFVSKYAQEGRSYALVTAGVVVATLLLLRAWERPTRGRWAAYAAAVLLVGLVHEFALLLPAAHGAALLATRGTARRVRLGWMAAVAAAALCAVPLVLLSGTQAAQVDWLPPVTWRTPLTLLETFAGPSGAVMAVVLSLAVLGLAVPVRRPGGPVALRTLALPWLVLPPALLMLASLGTPLYYDRYVLYSLPGMALLAAAGLDTAARTAVELLGRVARAPGPAVRTVAVGVLGVALAGGMLEGELHRQRELRTTTARADDFRAAAEVLRLSARPGDAVVFDPSNRRGMEDVYPDAFRGTVDALRTATPAASGTLSGDEVEVPRIESTLLGYARVWLVGSRRAARAASWDRAQELLRVLHADYRPAEQTDVRGFMVQLWFRR